MEAQATEDASVAPAPLPRCGVNFPYIIIGTCTLVHFASDDARCSLCIPGLRSKGYATFWFSSTAAALWQIRKSNNNPVGIANVTYRLHSLNRRQDNFTSINYLPNPRLVPIFQGGIFTHISITKPRPASTS